MAALPGDGGAPGSGAAGPRLGPGPPPPAAPRLPANSPRLRANSPRLPPNSPRRHGVRGLLPGFLRARAGPPSRDSYGAVGAADPRDECAAKAPSPFLASVRGFASAIGRLARGGGGSVYEEIAAREQSERDRFGETRRPSAQRGSRILLRDAVDHQSMGRWNIKRVGGHWVSMYMDDWFNTVAHLPFLRLMILMATFYILLVFAFALMYLAFSDKCGMDFNDKIEAYYFSLETMATIGYGTQDYFFGHCWEPLVIINLQVTASLVVESLYFGIIFHRVSRGRNRTNTVLFSDKAVIRRVGDAFYLVFQVCELRRHHLLDARVRVFAVRHERDAHGTAYYQAHRLTLRRPNDATGGMLLMALPQLVVHRLDAASPLVPGTTWMARDGLRTWAGLAAPPETEPPRPNFAATTPRTNSPQKRRGRTSPVPTHRHSRRPSADIKMFVPHVRRRRSAVSGHAAPATHHESPFRVPRRPGLLSRALDRAFDDGASEVPFEEHPMSSPEPSTPDVDHDQFCSPRKVSDADRPRSASPREHRGAHPLGARIGAHPPGAHPLEARCTISDSDEPHPLEGARIGAHPPGAHPLDARRTISDELPPPPPPPGTAKSLEEGLRLARDEGVRREIEAFFEDRDVEIVGIVEGNDEITGRLSQARHSYALEDLGWWRNFAPCVFREKSGSCLVDFGEFHRVV